MKKISTLFALLLISSSCCAMSAGRRLLRSFSKKTLKDSKPLPQAEELDEAIDIESGREVQFVPNYELSWALNKEIDYIDPEEIDPVRCLSIRRSELTFIWVRRVRQSDRTFDDAQRAKIHLEINYVKGKIDEITRQIQENCNNK